MAARITDQNPVEGKPACLGEQFFGRTEKPIAVDAEVLMDCQAVLMDAVNEMPVGQWRSRFERILGNLRDSIAERERVA